MCYRLLVLVALAGLVFGCQTVGTRAPSGKGPYALSPKAASRELVARIEAKLLEAEPDAAAPDILARLAPIRPSDPEIEQQVAREIEGLEKKKGAELPITINSQVRWWINYFQVRNGKRFAQWLALLGRYSPMMKEILNQYGLPEDLVYLAMIESGFSCQAYSKAHAVGPWQFIRPTARRYGLKMDAWVDERRDPVKATHAAAQYLRDLYAEFGTWYLACAGYNAGEAKIHRALKYHKADNFWEIANPTKRRRSYIKRETRNYVPKMIAAAIIAKDPASYGFADIVYEEPLAFNTVTVTKPVDLKKLAKVLGCSYKELKALNPELRYHTTPQNGKSYPLRVPDGSSQSWLASLDKVKAAPIKTYITHVLRRGENPGLVAKKYKVSVRQLLAVNNIKDPRRLRTGTRLKVPVRSVGYVDSGSSKGAAVHVLRPGENPGLVAQKYNVSVKKLLAANNINDPKRLRPGTRLRIPGRSAVRVDSSPSPNAAVHVLKPGEYPGLVAKKYNVTVKQLLAANNIKNPRNLRPGTKLKVPGRQASTKKSSSGAKSDLSRTKERPVKQVSIAAKAASTKSSSPEGVVRHVVRPGDNAWALSQKYNVSYKRILAHNNISNHRHLKIGQTLEIPTVPRQAQSGNSKTAKRPTKTVIHVVRSGETLWEIAQSYNISYRSIIAWNNIRNHRHLKPGQRLSLHIAKDEAS